MPAKDHFTESLDDFNPYYAPYYDDESKNSPKGKKSKTNSENSDNSNSSDSNKNLLRRAENSAVSRNEPSFGQNSPNSPWKSNVRGKTPVIPGPKGALLTIKRKKGFAAAITILLFLIGGGFFIGSSNILLPGALSARFTSETNSGYAGYSIRSVKLTSYMLKNLNNTTTTDFRGLARYTHMSSSLKQRLAKNHIEVEGSGSDTVLKWSKTTPSGGTETVTIGASAFQSEYLNNADFRADYDTARRSRVSLFFDSLADKFYQKIGFSRNVAGTYEKTGNSETDTENYKKTMAEQYDNNSTEFTNRGKVETDEYEYETDANGNVIYENGQPVIKTDADGNPIRVSEMENNSIATSQTDGSSTDAAEVQARGYVADLAQKLAVGANTACALMKFGHAISITISALETYASIHRFLNPMENVSRTMYGEESYINEFLNEFTTPVNATVELYNQGIQVTDINNPENTSVATTTVYGAPIQAQGAQVILGGRKGVSNDIVNYSTERVSSTVAKALQMSPEAMKTCIGVQAGAAVVSFAVTILSAGTKVVADFAWDIIRSAAIGLAASAIVSFAIPTLAKYLFTNVFETVTGIPAGELFASGAANSNFKNGTYGGQIPASKDSVLNYYQSVRQVAALDAEVDRRTLSPLDISSPNTFLGSIAYNTILPLATSSGNLFSTIGSIFRTTSSSISNILGAAHAAGEGDSYMVTFGNDLGICPQLDALGYACDMYGNHIPISVLLDIEPDDPRYLQFIQENIDENGEVIENSFLAKFILASVNRDSSIGTVDTNILGAFEVGNPIIGSIPFIGDLVDLWDAGQDAENFGWADGTYVGDSPNNDYREQALLASCFITDNRVLDTLSDDSTDLAYQNPITAFLEKYESEHPLDNSLPGYIARITGLPKSTAETLIATAEYYMFIKDYDPSTRIAMITENTTVQPAEAIIARFENTKLDFSNKSASESNQEIFLAKQSEQYIIYADIRNRSYAA